jgi:2-polyprenyl-6-methoxyphenol hydroxylase-like FAD-dependent oxidoreductase
MSSKTVLISGVGIGGPTLAYWLNRAGFETTLVERAPRLRTGGYAIDFWGRGYTVAERMGLLDDINRVGYHIREMRIVNVKGERISGFGTSVFRKLTAGNYVTIGRSELSRLLVETIVNDTEIIFDDEIIGLQELPDCVQVTFKRGGERRFSFVVGADGLHSAVRRLMFGAQGRFEKRLGYMVAAFETRGYELHDEDVYVAYCRPGQMLGRLTLRDDRTLFLFVFATGDDPQSEIYDTAAQKTLLRDVFGAGGWETSRILAELDDSEDLYFDRVSQIKMPRWSQGRIVLLGDAAFCVSLMAGQGAALAMTAAYVLAGELSIAGEQHEKAFFNYEHVLRRFIEAKQEGAARFASVFAPRSKLGLFLRNLILKATAIPGVARLSFGSDIVDKLQLPDYRWVESRSVRRASGTNGF